MTNKLYDVVFYCFWADYHWTEHEGLSLTEATEAAERLNKEPKPHLNGCCQYFIEKQ